MKTVFWHGLGQTAQDWEKTIYYSHAMDIDCPELLALTGGNITYSRILNSLEERYSGITEPFRICGLSLGAVLALEYAIRHGSKVSSLVLIGGQYKVPSLLIDLQNLLFCCMPDRAFQSTGLSKSRMIELTRSMRTLNLSERLNEIACPVIVVCGEKDTANIKAARQMKKLLSQAELYIVPNAGHEINKCAPKELAAILDLHIEEQAIVEKWRKDR